MTWYILNIYIPGHKYTQRVLTCSVGMTVQFHGNGSKKWGVVPVCFIDSRTVSASRRPVSI